MDESDQLLSCTCASSRDDEVLIRLHGEIDMASAPLLHDLLVAARELSSAAVVLDMSEVSFLDSSGINEILRADRHTTVRVRSASNPVRRCLAICGLDHLLEDPADGEG